MAGDWIKLRVGQQTPEFMQIASSVNNRAKGRKTMDVFLSARTA